jgi:hypothetical protein
MRKPANDDRGRAPACQNQCFQTSKTTLITKSLPLQALQHFRDLPLPRDALPGQPGQRQINNGVSQPLRNEITPCDLEILPKKMRARVIDQLDGLRMARGGAILDDVLP